MKKFEAIRTEIKRLSAEQKVLKPQRKPTKDSDGKIQTENVRKNKFTLRHLFYLYAIWRDKEPQKMKKGSGYSRYPHYESGDSKIPFISESFLEELSRKYKPTEEPVVE